jgi:hypothetical protein
VIVKQLCKYDILVSHVDAMNLVFYFLVFF